MYIFQITEIEQIIFSYLDYYLDFSTLKQMSKNYKTIINNNKIYKELYNFGGWNINCIEKQFIEACKINIFVAKYLFYTYTSLDIHTNNESPFQWSCMNGRLDIACWLCGLDGKINLHADDESAFFLSCVYGHLDVAKWLWSLDGKIDLHINGDIVFYWCICNDHHEIVYWLRQLDDEIDLHDIEKMYSDRPTII